MKRKREQDDVEQLTRTCFQRLLKLKPEDNLPTLQLLLDLLARQALDPSMLSEESWIAIIDRLCLDLSKQHAIHILTALCRGLNFAVPRICGAFLAFGRGLCGLDRLEILNALLQIASSRLAAKAYLLDHTDFLLHSHTCAICSTWGKYTAMKIMGELCQSYELILDSESRRLCREYLREADDLNVVLAIEILFDHVINTPCLPIDESSAIVEICLAKLRELAQWTRYLTKRGHCVKFLRLILVKLAQHPRHAAQIVKSKQYINLIYARSPRKMEVRTRAQVDRLLRYLEPDVPANKASRALRKLAHLGLSYFEDVGLARCLSANESFHQRLADPRTKKAAVLVVGSLAYTSCLEFDLRLVRTYFVETKRFDRESWDALKQVAAFCGWPFMSDDFCRRLEQTRSVSAAENLLGALAFVVDYSYEPQTTLLAPRNFAVLLHHLTLGRAAAAAIFGLLAAYQCPLPLEVAQNMVQCIANDKFLEPLLSLVAHSAVAREFISLDTHCLLPSLRQGHSVAFEILHRCLLQSEKPPKPASGELEDLALARFRTCWTGHVETAAGVVLALCPSQFVLSVRPQSEREKIEAHIRSWCESRPWFAARAVKARIKLL